MDKRRDYLSWDEYFMGIALMSSQRSKDPGTQVGACIVNDENRIMSVGYNGMPAEKFIWAWIKSEFLIPKRLTFYNTNVYYHLLDLDEKEKKLKKEAKKRHVKNAKHSA